MTFRQILTPFKNKTQQGYQLCEKNLKALTDEEISLHLEGKQFIGIYPLLKDNSTWFLAADFDKENWEIESKIFIRACKDKDIPAYLERSRSGKGGHVWIFFEKSLLAATTRKLFIHILQECGVFSVFDKKSSFDRLFPNQDYLSGKGFGNLIALPFNKSYITLSFRFKHPAHQFLKRRIELLQYRVFCKEEDE